MWMPTVFLERCSLCMVIMKVVVSMVYGCSVLHKGCGPSLSIVSLLRVCITGLPTWVRAYSITGLYSYRCAFLQA